MFCELYRALTSLSFDVRASFEQRKNKKREKRRKEGRVGANVTSESVQRVRASSCRQPFDGIFEADFPLRVRAEKQACTPCTLRCALCRALFCVFIFSFFHLVAHGPSLKSDEKKKFSPRVCRFSGDGKKPRAKQNLFVIDLSLRRNASAFSEGEQKATVTFTSSFCIRSSYKKEHKAASRSVT